MYLILNFEMNFVTIVSLESSFHIYIYIYITKLCNYYDNNSKIWSMCAGKQWKFHHLWLKWILLTHNKLLLCLQNLYNNTFYKSTFQLFSEQFFKTFFKFISSIFLLCCRNINPSIILQSIKSRSILFKEKIMPFSLSF